VVFAKVVRSGSEILSQLLVSVARVRQDRRLNSVVFAPSVHPAISRSLVVSAHHARLVSLRYPVIFALLVHQASHRYPAGHVLTVRLARSQILVAFVNSAVLVSAARLVLLNATSAALVKLRKLVASALIVVEMAKCGVWHSNAARFVQLRHSPTVEIFRALGVHPITTRAMVRWFASRTTESEA